VVGELRPEGEGGDFGKKDRRDDAQVEYGYRRGSGYCP
jgi:hypothetical protein